MIKKTIKSVIFGGREIRDRVLSSISGQKIRSLLAGASFDNPPQHILVQPQEKERTERVLILVPAHNVERFVAQFVRNLTQLSYPHSLIDIAFLEGDSTDDSYSALKKHITKLTDFHSVRLEKKDWGDGFHKKRWRTSKQRARREKIAQVRNHLLNTALSQQHEWVLWIDGDVIQWQADIINKLLSYGRDILVPCCVDEAGKDFDLNSFAYDYDKKLNWHSYIKDGLLQPPVGFGRSYLSALTDYDLVTLDGVGATMLLVKADIHRQGIAFPEEPLHHHIETEGFAFLARQHGISSWGAPNITIIHPRY